MANKNTTSGVCRIYLVVTKGLRKAENSDFCIFAKFGTRFFCILYSIFSVLRQNCILQNTKHNTEFSKALFWVKKP